MIILAQATNSVPTLGQTASNLYQVVMANKEAIVAVWGAIVLLARTLRKVIPDPMQTGIAGTVLKHAALEINPQTATNQTKV